MAVAELEGNEAMTRSCVGVGGKTSLCSLFAVSCSVFLMAGGCFDLNVEATDFLVLGPSRETWRGKQASSAGAFLCAMADARKPNLGRPQRAAYRYAGCLLKGEWHDARLVLLTHECGLAELAKVMFNDLPNAEKLLVASRLVWDPVGAATVDQRKAAIENILIMSWASSILIGKAGGRDFGSELGPIYRYALLDLKDMLDLAMRNLNETAQQDTLAPYQGLVEVIRRRVREDVVPRKPSEKGVQKFALAPACLRRVLDWIGDKEKDFELAKLLVDAMNAYVKEAWGPDSPHLLKVSLDAPPEKPKYDPERAAKPVEVDVKVKTRPSGLKVYYSLGYSYEGHGTICHDDEVGPFLEGKYAGCSPLTLKVVDKGYSYVNFRFVGQGGEWAEQYDKVPKEVTLDTKEVTLDTAD